MTDAELDALVARRPACLAPEIDRDQWIYDAADAIATLRQERDHFRDCISAREVRRIVDERDAARAEADALRQEQDAARAENEKLRALLLDAKAWAYDTAPQELLDRIDAYLRRKGT
jgi:uncharacterized protein (DUF3084 family)